MPRVVSLFLPTWSTDRLRRILGGAAPPAEAPLVLIGREGSGGWCWPRMRPRAAPACASACRPAKAQALVPGLVVMDAEPAADAEALERLALWALQRYAPIVAADPPDGLVIDITGAAHLHGGEDAMLADMIERLGRTGFAARAAIADQLGCGPCPRPLRGAAEYRRPCGRKLRDDPRLPIAALRLPATWSEDLRVSASSRRRSAGKTPRAAGLALRSGTRPPSRSGDRRVH